MPNLRGIITSLDLKLIQNQKLGQINQEVMMPSLRGIITSLDSNLYTVLNKSQWRKQTIISSLHRNKARKKYYR